MLTHIKRLDRFLDYHAPILVLLLIVFLLRIPNLFEPYWYGDEGIYLTIGTALNMGRELYAEIIDHKTPLIYFFAQIGSQLGFRLLLLGWMLTSTALFYSFTHRVLRSRLSASVATGIFLLFTTLPWFEGHIPNGELFMMGFVLLGAVLLSHTELFSAFLHTRRRAHKNSHPVLLFFAGVSFGLAILTKVPALFDLAAFLSVAFFALTNVLSFKKPELAKWQSFAIHLSKQVGIILLGALTPILLSVLYFWLRGTVQAYLDYGLLYNFRYAGTWQLSFDNPLLTAAFSFPGKLTIAGSMILAATLLRRFLSPVFQLALSWVALSLFASLLSNRPYPHYFLQVIPALALMLGTLFHHWVRPNKHALRVRAVETTASLTLLGVFLLVLSLLRVGFYPTVSYYQNWFSLVTHRISTEEYRQRFNPMMEDNYRAAAILATAQDPQIFIWGTNPMLYALSNTIPAGRFTVSFHIQDFHAYDETFAAVTAVQPEYIVVMNDEKKSFPALQTYLFQNYIENPNFTHFSVWRKR